MMKINNGKRFEDNFKRSVPKDILYYRFRDGSSSWGGNDKVRFQQTNICDCLLYDSKYLYLLELKSTKGKSLPFANIKQHQIDDLLWASEFKNTICGFVIDFSELNECYFIEISQFKTFLDNSGRKSLPIDFCVKNGMKIGLELVKVNKKYYINEFIKEINEKGK